MIKFNNKTIASVYVGKKAIEKIYKGTQLIFSAGIKNLLPDEILDINNWSNLSANTNCWYLDSYLEVGKTYKISFEATRYDGGYGYLYFQYSENDFVNRTTTNLTQNTRIVTNPHTFEVLEGNRYRFWFYNNPLSDFNEIFSSLVLEEVK